MGVLGDAQLPQLREGAACEPRPRGGGDAADVFDVKHPEGGGVPALSLQGPWPEDPHTNMGL